MHLQYQEGLLKTTASSPAPALLHLHRLEEAEIPIYTGTALRKCFYVLVIKLLHWVADCRRCCSVFVLTINYIKVLLCLHRPARTVWAQNISPSSDERRTAHSVNWNQRIFSDSARWMNQGTQLRMEIVLLPRSSVTANRDLINDLHLFLSGIRLAKLKLNLHSPHNLEVHLVRLPPSSSR